MKKVQFSERSWSRAKDSLGVKRFILLLVLVVGFSGFHTTSAQCSQDISQPSGISPGIKYSYYEGSWNSLPDFSLLTPVSSGITSEIGISEALNGNYFGFTFQGYINVPSDGVYTFFTTSDDGSSLWIDGNQVVDNDGLHASEEESGDICLEAGYHSISVNFFEKTGGNVLSVSYAGPGISKTTLTDLYTTSSIDNSCKSTAYTEAECYDDEEGVVVEQSGSGSSDENLGHLHDGDWASYNDIDLTNMNSFNALVSTPGSGRTVEVRLNGTSGTLIGTLAIPNTGQWHSYTSTSTSLTSTVTGTHDVFLVFKGGAFNIGSFGFTGSTGTTDCAGVTNGTASIDACGICSGGTTGITPSSPQTWYADVDGDGVGDAGSSVQDCNQPSGYVASSGDNCPNDANKTNPGDCGCGVVEGTCSGGCIKTTEFTEAECFDDEEGVVVEQSGSGSSDENLGHLHDGDWARYNNIDLSNVNMFNAYISTTRSGTSIEVHLDSENGTLIATLNVPNNGAWHEYSDRSAALTSTVSGTHDIFLVFKGGALNIGSFGFSDEDIVVPDDCSSLTSNISLSFTNPTCSNNNGSITVSFANASDQSQIQLSLNGGASYIVTVNDNSGSYTFTGLSKANYQVAARYSNNVCEYNVGHLYLAQDCEDIPFNPGGVGWMDSYDANGFCWCRTNFDHNLDDEGAIINGTRYGVVDICDELENHPLYRSYSSGDAIYNDIQCGHGPKNDTEDEDLCPGRVDEGKEGCLWTGNHWDMEWLASRARFGANNARLSGFETEEFNLLYVQPSIASDKITVVGVAIGEVISIYTLNGVKVKEVSYVGEINIANVASGVYLLKADGGTTRFTKE